MLKIARILAKKRADLSVEIRTWSPWHLEYDIFEKVFCNFQWRDPNPQGSRPKILSTSACEGGHKVRRKWGDFAQRPHSLK